MNIVLFNDPYGDITDPVGCSGTLAIGGYWRSGSISKTVNGIAYYPATRLYVIFNNASYRILKERTKALKGFSAEDDRYVAMDLDNPLIDYPGLARSLGVPGERVEKAVDVGPAVARALASGGPALIDVRVDPSFT